MDELPGADLGEETRLSASEDVLMRALEGGSSLHPELARLLAERDAGHATASSPGTSAATGATSAATAATTSDPVRSEAVNVIATPSKSSSSTDK